ncbi:hypothetical protein RHMOL_Rhmol10G0032500 [Rhododendron molle]|uniref:Uncharacterized protein n=1 Tax=Rhododendron molle TaxID=49168 RepID=A0ACC0LYJ3_RHOML|nr:hypothetical protein RHMOL_Rhmol10G0032500 [Rhododendron molle]
MTNVECAVRPPSNNKEAMPDEATVTTVCPRLRHFCAMMLYKNVFPVPAGTPIQKEGSSFISKERANNDIISIALVNVKATDIILCICLLGLDMKLSMLQNQSVTNNCSPVFHKQ